MALSVAQEDLGGELPVPALDQNDRRLNVSGGVSGSRILYIDLDHLKRVNDTLGASDR